MTTANLRIVAAPTAIDQLVTHLNTGALRITSLKRGYTADNPTDERAYLDITITDTTRTAA